MQNLVEIDAVVLAVMLSPLRSAHDTPHSPLCENMPSSTKPEVHIDDDPEDYRATATGNMYKLW